MKTNQKNSATKGPNLRESAHEGAGFLPALSRAFWGWGIIITITTTAIPFIFGISELHGSITYVIALLSILIFFGFRLAFRPYAQNNEFQIDELLNSRLPIRSAIKRLFDIVAASIMLVLVFPLFLIIVFVISTLDQGPVFFRHPRVGLNGNQFGCLKFRTMAPNSAELLGKLLATDPGARLEWQCTQKLKNDPRITRVGRVLRQTSLDELPQLLNVIRGDMSLVGPRPVTADEIQRFGKNAKYYIATRPGITGLWQVSGGQYTTYAERVQLDTIYVKSWSLRKDFFIILKTVLVVFRGATSF